MSGEVMGLIFGVVVGIFVGMGIWRGLTVSKKDYNTMRDMAERNIGYAKQSHQDFMAIKLELDKKDLENSVLQGVIDRITTKDEQ